MDSDRLLKRALYFYKLATSEELPADSKDLSTVLKNLEKLKSYNARKEYAEKNLKHLSSGSSRIVYLTPKNTIIKLAKNDKGIAQNKAESNSSKLNSKCLNKVIRSSSHFEWIEVPFVNKITEKDFKRMTDIDFKDFGEAIRFSLKKISGNTDMEKPDHYDDIKESPIFEEITKIGESLNLMPGDIARISSWGAKDDQPILLDTGLTKKIFEDFYEDPDS